MRSMITLLCKTGIFRSLTLWMLLAGLVLSVGCGGKKAEDDEAAAPTGPVSNVKISRIDIHKKIGSKLSEGGQFVLTTVAIENISSADATYGPDLFFIRKKTTGDETPYEQAFESGMSKHFKEEFGKESLSYMLNLNTVIHPGFTVNKVIVFNLPEQDELSAWEVVYKPEEIVLPLDDPTIELVDHRKAVQQPKNPDASEQ